MYQITQREGMILCMKDRGKKKDSRLGALCYIVH